MKNDDRAKFISSICIVIFLIYLCLKIASGVKSNSVNVAQKEKIIPLSVADLYNEYDKNEVATDEKLKGAVVEINGIVQSIDKDFMDQIVIVLYDTDNEYKSIYLTMEQSEKEIAIHLRKGKKITIRCKKMSRILGSPYGSQCIFVK